MYIFFLQILLTLLKIYFVISYDDWNVKMSLKYIDHSNLHVLQTIGSFGMLASRMYIYMFMKIKMIHKQKLSHATLEEL